MAQRYPKVQFRPSAVPGLRERGPDQEATGIAIRDLKRYHAVLQRSRPSLTRGEWLLLCDVLNGTVLDESTAGYLRTEIEDAFDEDPSLAAKWQVDAPALIEKLRHMPFAELLAVIDTVERFWMMPSDADSNAQLDALGVPR